MAKYHINPAGEPGACSAQQGNCPFGGADEHHDTPELARSAFEKKQSDEFVAALNGHRAAPPAPVNSQAENLRLQGHINSLRAENDSMFYSLRQEQAARETAEGSLQDERKARAALEEEVAMLRRRLAESQARSEEPPMANLPWLTSPSSRMVSVDEVAGIMAPQTQWESLDVSGDGFPSSSEKVMISSVDAGRIRLNYSSGTSGGPLLGPGNTFHFDPASSYVTVLERGEPKLQYRPLNMVGGVPQPAF